MTDHDATDQAVPPGHAPAAAAIEGDHLARFVGGPHDGHVRPVPPSGADRTRPHHTIEVQTGAPPADPNDEPAPPHSFYPEWQPSWIRGTGRYRLRDGGPDDGVWLFDWAGGEDPAEEHPTTRLPGDHVGPIPADDGPGLFDS